MGTKNALRVLAGVLRGLGLLSATALIILSIYAFPPSAIFYGLAWTTIAGVATAAFSAMSALFFGISNYAAPPDKINETVFKTAFKEAYKYDHKSAFPMLTANDLSKIVSGLEGKDITQESIESEIGKIEGISDKNARTIAVEYMKTIGRN